jgi:DNA-binding NtrC family response regulator
MINYQADILIVDDQKSICYSIEKFLQIEGYSAISAQNVEMAMKLLETHEPRVVVMDIRMPETSGLEALSLIKEVRPNVQIIMMTAYSTTEQAIEAIKLGAFDYLIKPFENDDLLGVIQDALKAKVLMEDVVTCNGLDDLRSGEKIIGKSPQMLAIFKQIGKVAPSDAPVLIMGESGTGKELIARAIFGHSTRADKRFLAVNCAAIPEDLLESELFGYERGAFTGANFRKIGKFEQCDGGTIFLDEIGEMALSTQSKILRILQDGTFQRLGGNENVTSDFRLISATNKNLDQLAKEKNFRQDLFYRIETVTIRVPPLRERTEDITELATHFVQRYRKLLSKNIKGITQKTLKVFEQHSWPGNVRELESLIHRAVILCIREYLCVDCCVDLKIEPNISVNPTVNEAMENLVSALFENNSQVNLQELILSFEKAVIKRALVETTGNQVQAANLLGISRNTLRKKMPQLKS